MRLLTYTAVSVVSVAALLYSTQKQYTYFYPSLIHLTTSNLSLMLLLNFCLMSLLWISKLVQYIFIGPLRVIEVEHLYERGWFAVSESFLALTVFREDIGSWFVVWFCVLGGIKCFHWLLQDRVDMVRTCFMLLTGILYMFNSWNRPRRLRKCFI